ncbi:hypothetical protein QRD43_20655 [Pelomonas sp. APW6]|uniref:Uncharacterized protein n=1 Tax=Roseateles subflavus TaxID=3053353 RepID=A0ABT7LN94_9BURK|nr:hypothetical protein [Pelomonas sp. APW6]MDL5034325.1 hypothetical protein [Pelomonas sp. APW6]
MKTINVLTSAACRLAVTFQANPFGSVILVLLASCGVAGLWTWKT